jgi:hypothetical protein
MNPQVRLRDRFWSTTGTVAWSPGSGPIRAARDAQSERGVLRRAVIGVQGGSRSKRQGWTRPAGRDGAPLADVTAVRGPPCAFAPGVAGHTAPLPQAGRGEHRCRRERFTCARSACATSPGARASMRRDEQDFSCLAGRSVRGRRDVREVHRPGAAGCGPGSGRGQDAQPQLHRHRAHPARPDPRGRGRRRQGAGVAGDQPGGGPPAGRKRSSARASRHRPGTSPSLRASRRSWSCRCGRPCSSVTTTSAPSTSCSA